MLKQNINKKRFVCPQESDSYTLPIIFFECCIAQHLPIDFSSLNSRLVWSVLHSKSKLDFNMFKK